MSGKSKSIQERMNELSNLVSWFQSPDFELDKATERFLEAEKLAADIEKELDGLKNTIDVIKKRFDQDEE